MKQIDQHIQQYIQSLEMGGKSPNTIRAYKKDVEKWVLFFNLSDLLEAEKLSVSDYMNFYKESGLEGKSLNSLIRNLSSFFNSIRFVENNSFFNVRFGGRKFVKENKVIKPVLTTEECEKIIMAGSNVQEKFMVAMALKTALRRSEIADIKMTDIQNCQIKITGKGGDESYTYLNETLCHMLNIYMTERKTESPYLFYATRGESAEGGKLSGVSINNRVLACAKRAGIVGKKVTAHRLRATAITQVAITKGRAVAQGLARHKNGTTTDLYINTQDAVRKLLLED